MDEGMKSPQSPDNLMTRPEVEVVGIAQETLHADLHKIFGGQGFDRTLGSYREKGRGGERAMVCVDLPQSPFGRDIFFNHLESKSHISKKR
jgi:hypothetical protein